jgi:hypothetical protein
MCKKKGSAREKESHKDGKSQWLNLTEETPNFSIHMYLQVGERATDGLQFDEGSQGLLLELTILHAMQIREGCHVPRSGNLVSQPYMRKS